MRAPHRDAAGRVRPDPAAFAAAHPTRCRVVETLAAGKAARDVPALAADVGVPRSHLYHHLAALEAAGLVTRDGTGRGRTYRLARGAAAADPAPAHVAPPSATRVVRVECPPDVVADFVRVLRERFDVAERGGALRVRRRPS